MLLNHLKNIPGWKTKRKLVVFSVDDYGNVFLDSKKARNNMTNAGLKVRSRFDAYDTLETREDLEALYEVLISVKDKNKNPAVFTPYALPCNIDFEQMEYEGHQGYHYELLPDTYLKLSHMQPQAYEGAWQMWQEGINIGLMKPQFHGREHFNLKVFEEKLASRDNELITSLQNRSYASISDSGYATIGWTAAFAFSNNKDIEYFPNILKTGTDAFKEVYGYRSSSFTPPAQQFPSSLEPELSEFGVEYLDRPLYQNRHEGEGKFNRELNYLGKKRKGQLITLVRNVVFEPTHDDNALEKAMKQIEAAFRLNKPANISSHRVNYCGHIDEKNRKMGLDALKALLYQIVKRWPNVEFVSSDQLGEIIKRTQKRF